jgi:hypothetical protein
MSHTIWRRILWMSAVAAISNILYAVDGVVLIDPSRVRNGSITPGDAPGFPVTVSQSGSYRLAGNLVIPDAQTTAIEITADNVTLDLSGFSIIGPNVCTPNPTRCTLSAQGVGIHAGSFSTGIVAPNGVRVMNGIVRGMGFHGVRLMGEGTAVERVYTTNNGGPGIVVGGGSVIDSTAVLNGGAGIIGWVVRGSISANSSSAGIFIRPGGVAAGNTAYSNGSDGILMTNGTVDGNTANNNVGFGISATCPGSIVGNTTVGNQSGSLRATGLCTLANNTP